MGLADLRKADLFVRGAATKAWTALLERRLPFSPVWWAKAMALHWQEMRAAAPRSDGPRPMDRHQLELSYGRWLQLQERAVTTSVSAAMSNKPGRNSELLSIVALVDRSTDLTPVLESVRAQTSIDWELWIIADDQAQIGALASDPRIDNGHIKAVWLGALIRPDGTWLPPGSGTYVVLLGPDTWLASDAVCKVLPEIANGGADWIYTDDDRLHEGRRVDPNLKGAFSPELALGDDYATRLAVVRRRAIQDAGGLQGKYREAQIYDLLLRIVAGGATVKHAAVVACHRRSSVPSALGSNHRAAAERFMADRGIPAVIHLGRRHSPSTFELQDIVWPRDVLATQQVTIVIPTRDRVDMLARCVESIRRTVDLDRVRLLIVDDRSQYEATHRYLATLTGDPKFRCRVLRPAVAGEPFNYARIMNAGSREVETDLMLHLNNDIEAVSPGWLDQMTGWLAFGDIGIVGAKLLYPDGSIQHAGVIVSPSLGAPGHLFTGLIGSDMGYQWLPHRVRNVSAVTGACLLTRTALFRELGGFDEEHLAVQFNDTDYCLRAIGAGKRVVYEPSAVLLHRESASRGKGYDYRETLYFLEKYRDYRDPYASRLLDVGSVYGPTPLVAS